VEITINGVKTNYTVLGQGQPLLILHGWGSNSERWLEVAEPLSKKFKVIIPDIPGFGKSEVLQEPWNLNKYVSWADEFVRQLKLGDFYLLGHSFGGALASKISIKHAQEIKKLFLVSAACIRRKTNKKGISARIAKVVKIFSFLPFYTFFRKAVYKFIIRRSDYVYVEGIMKQTYLNVISDDLSFHLPFIKVPTVIIWGDKDEMTPIEDARLINEKIRNSKLVVIPGAGHDLNRKQPEIVAQDVLNNI
jgi:pimeloyl-ACP methyl ester carboxylesterase